MAKRGRVTGPKEITDANGNKYWFDAGYYKGELDVDLSVGKAVEFYVEGGQATDLSNLERDDDYAPSVADAWAKLQAAGFVRGIAAPDQETPADALVAAYMEHCGLDRTVVFESRRLDTALAVALAKALRDPPILNDIRVTFEDIVTSHRHRIAVIAATLDKKAIQFSVEDALALVRELDKIARTLEVGRSLEILTSDITDEQVAIALTPDESRLFTSLGVTLF